MTPPPAADQFARQLKWEDLNERDLLRIIQIAKAEDLEGFGLNQKPALPLDVTTTLVPSRVFYVKPFLVARKPMVVAGLPLVSLILKSYGGDASFTALSTDGNTVTKGTHLGHFEGNPKTILQAERIILNFLQRLSGIATLTQSYVDALGNSKTRLLDTRKTTPGLRVLEKYATACGGGFNHRIGLFDRVMLKDNHLEASGATHGASLSQLIQSAKTHFPQVPVEVEVDHLSQIPHVINAGADIILLDNFSLTALKKAITLCSGKIVTEASGGIFLEALCELGKLGLDFISTGATIHQAQWTDIGLDWS